MFASAFFTSLNNGLISAIISIVRSLVFELVCVLTLPLLWQVDGVYASAVFAEIGSSLMTIFFFVTQKKKYGY
jgi:Na+-driven multidrug efflux pump